MRPHTSEWGARIAGPAHASNLPGQGRTALPPGAGSVTNRFRKSFPESFHEPGTRITMASQKNALIVGASRGLGLGLVETFLQRGWRVTATQRSASPASRRWPPTPSRSRRPTSTTIARCPPCTTAWRARAST